jgi:hypothetical protein
MKTYRVIITCIDKTIRNKSYIFSSENDEQALEIVRIIKQRVLKRNKYLKLAYTFALFKEVFVSC